jgi:hypothetical protein
VNAVNTQLMSDEELTDFFEEYEAFLKSLNFKIQQQIVSQPVDLKVYIDSQKEILEQIHDPKRKQLLESYIEYAKEIETSSQIIQRKRYIIFSAPIRHKTEKAYRLALSELKENEKHVISGLGGLDLKAEPLNDLELIRCLHVLFDYENAQLQPSLNDEIQQTITGGR